MADMATQPDTADGDMELCRLCGFRYGLSEGRKHGFIFKCNQCLASERALRRNLGEGNPQQEWTNEESEGFFRQLLEKKKEEPGGVLRWTTVRATMLTQLVERAVSRFAAECETESLPLSVWVSRGWPEEVVKKQKSNFSEEYNCDVYHVPIRRLRWQQTWDREESRLLQKEKEAAQKKASAKAKAEAKAAGRTLVDLDVPNEATEKTNGKDDKVSARKEAAAAKKTEQANQKLASVAAKAMGPLTSSENTMGKLVVKAQEAAVTAALLTCAEDLLKKQREWLQHSRAAINGQEQMRTNGTMSPLSPLPFNSEDLKTLLKQSAETQKALKLAIPKKAAKPKATAAEKKAKEDTAEPAAKRRCRTKTPES